MKMAGCLVTVEGSLPFCILACRLNLGRLQNAFMEICQADSVEYWSCATNISLAGLRKQAPVRAQNPLAGLHFCWLKAHEVRLC